ncbi:MAG TPA: hypothetical protein VMJ12_04555 [Candidatus Acidoferrales bacterium]|nr:hypothetical protein [Candidatus Acidoferrales bacterium]
MALIFRGKSKCKICGEVIDQNDDIVATSHFIADRKDSLWPYSDAPFHKRCFLTWDRREEFVARFNEIATPRVFGSGNYHQMQNDGSIIQVKASN